MASRSAGSLCGNGIAMKVFILGRAVHGEKFWLITTLSEEEGVLSCLIRQSTKKTGTIVPDLFDEAELGLERQKAGAEGPRFAKEYTLLTRHTGISGDYAGLVYASRFATVLARNAFPPDARKSVLSLCRNAISAFSSKPRKDATYFKSLWLLARECGLPVREDWFESLPFDDKACVSRVLKTPLEVLDVPVREVERMISRIEFWLAHENDFSIF
ncbi:MAG: hypothetical protein IJX22_06240 [Opitutales bacterium]|nr:hypothetical protein [Opitutales bacterium]